MIGYYYLHTNGDLIFKRFLPDPSDFVRKIWRIDTDNRANAWTIVLEALALNASSVRIKELCAKWDLGLKDLPEFLVRVKPTKILRTGLELYFDIVASCDYDEWLDWLATTPKGQQPNWEAMLGKETSNVNP